MLRILQRGKESCASLGGHATNRDIAFATSTIRPALGLLFGVCVTCQRICKDQIISLEIISSYTILVMDGCGVRSIADVRVKAFSDTFKADSMTQKDLFQKLLSCCCESIWMSCVWCPHES